MSEPDGAPCPLPAGDAESHAATASWLHRLEAEVVLQIADFGLALNLDTSVRGPAPKDGHILQTLHYRAPELLLGDRYITLAADVWSVGCLMAKVTVGLSHWNGDSAWSQIVKISETKGTPADVPLTDLPDFKDSIPRFKGTG